jgi:hypothetical protein
MLIEWKAFRSFGGTRAWIEEGEGLPAQVAEASASRLRSGGRTRRNSASEYVEPVEGLVHPRDM